MIIPPGTCIFCKQPFSKENVYSHLGAKETQISGSCEKCFDDITMETEEAIGSHPNDD